MSTRDELERFVDSFNGDEAGDIDWVYALDGNTGYAMRGGNDVESVLNKARDALIAEGWRKMPSREELAAALWNLPINGMDWRELNELAERDAADYAEHRDYVLEQARAILALMDKTDD